jgi:hypothetical protein
MKPKMLTLLLCSAALLAGTPATGQTANAQEAGAADSNAWLRHIAGELARLRVELIEHRIECRRDSLPRLENELRQVRQEQARMDAEEQNQRRELTQLEEVIGKSGDAMERSQMENARKELESGPIEAVRTARASAARRESELAEKLRVEQAQLEQLDQQAKRLAAWLAGK